MSGKTEDLVVPIALILTKARLIADAAQNFAFLLTQVNTSIEYPIDPEVMNAIASTPEILDRIHATLVNTQDGEIWGLLEE